jgi:hypothetical protein
MRPYRAKIGASMKYEMRVQVYIRADHMGTSGLELSETQHIELKTLSDAAGVLVKLHEFFEELKKRGV